MRFLLSLFFGMFFKKIVHGNEAGYGKKHDWLRPV